MYISMCIYIYIYTYMYLILSYPTVEEKCAVSMQPARPQRTHAP